MLAHWSRSHVLRNGPRAIGTRHDLLQKCLGYVVREILADAHQASRLLNLRFQLPQPLRVHYTPLHAEAPSELGDAQVFHCVWRFERATLRRNESEFPESFELALPPSSLDGLKGFVTVRHFPRTPPDWRADLVDFST